MLAGWVKQTSKEPLTPKKKSTKVHKRLFRAKRIVKVGSKIIKSVEAVEIAI
jgi:hypothetical protein